MNQPVQIAQLGNEILRLQARRVDDFACAKFHELVSVLQRLMLEHNGVGIAAPQVGESWQIVVVASRPTPRYPHAPEMAAVTMVNPEFDVTDRSIEKDWEGCLSIPGIRARVPRYRAIKVRYQNPAAEYCELALSGFPARVFQHEYDHLLGKVYLDRVENNADIISESEYCKLMAA